MAAPHPGNRPGHLRAQGRAGFGRRQVVASEQEECRVELLPGGGAEQDPEDWWALITCGVFPAYGPLPSRRNRSWPSACTAQWSGTVPVDARGCPIRNAIIWMDSRGAPVRAATSPEARCRCRATARTSWPMDPQDRRDPRAQRQGPNRAHPVAQALRAGVLPLRPLVPGAEGLAEPSAHRPGGCVLRLDRAALGD